MLRKPKLLVTLTAGVALVASIAQAAIDLPSSSLRRSTFNDIVVVDGGVTVDEATLARQMAGRYPLRVVLSGRNGSYYVADRLTVWRDARLVAEIPDAGPWLLMDLPPGRYVLQGLFNGGVTQNRQVVVGANTGTTVHWVLPESVS